MTTAFNPTITPRAYRGATYAQIAHGKTTQLARPITIMSTVYTFLKMLKWSNAVVGSTGRTWLSVGELRLTHGVTIGDSRAGAIGAIIPARTRHDPEPLAATDIGVPRGCRLRPGCTRARSFQMSCGPVLPRPVLRAWFRKPAAPNRHFPVNAMKGQPRRRVISPRRRSSKARLDRSPPRAAAAVLPACLPQ